MTPFVAIPLFALLIIAPVAVILVLGVFKLIALLGNAMLGRTKTVHSASTGRPFGHVLAGVIPICMIVLMLVLFKARSANSVYVEMPQQAVKGAFMVEQRPATLAQEGAVVVAEELAVARQEILQASQELSGLIPVDLPIEVPNTVAKPAPEPLLGRNEPIEAGKAESEKSSADDPSDATVSSQATAETESSDEIAAPVAAAADPVTDETIAPKPNDAVEDPALNSEEPASGAKPATAEPGESTEEVTAPAMPPAAETPEQRQARLMELASHISPWIRSLLKEDQPEETATASDVAEAVESSDKRIVVFQLAGPIRQKYALIPLTPAFDAALSPVTPFLANGSLESIAESLAAFLKMPAKTPGQEADVASGAENPSSSAETSPVATADVTQPVAVALAETSGVPAVDLSNPGGNRLIYAEGIATAPDWIKNPGPQKFVVRTRPLFPKDDTTKPLNTAINDVLKEHLSVFEESMDPALVAQARLVRLELDEATSQACILKSYERTESVGNSVGDKQDMRIVYALVELPESVRQAAVQTVRMSLQRDRVTGLAVIVGLAWLAICAASVVVRLWGRGGFFRKIIAIPLLCLICIPLLILAVGTGAATAGIPGSKMPRYPWADGSKPIRIQVP